MTVEGRIARLRVVEAETVRHLVLHVDGGCSAEGVATFGVVIREHGRRPFLRLSKVLTAGATANEAEWRAVIAALHWLSAARWAQAAVYCDSQLVVRQLEGTYKCRAEHLRKYFDEGRRLMTVLRVCHRRFSVSWVRREKNREADRLATKTMRRHASQQQGG